MITIPLCNAATSHFLGEEEPDADKKQTIFASCQNDEFKINGSGTPVGVTIYKSPIPWIIRKTSECYPKDMSDLWDQTEQKLPAEMESLSNGMEVAWYRYMFRKDETNPDPESNASVNKEEPALDEVILKDKSHLIILDFGGGTDLAGLKEAVAAFEEDDKPYMGAPKIVLDGHNYFATELCIVNEVPERYLYAGELTDQEKKYAFIDGSKYYTPNSDGVPEDFYIYQECGTPVSEHEVDNTKRQWAYVKETGRLTILRGIYMENKRFEITETAGSVKGFYVVVDKETGVNYVVAKFGTGVGICPLIDKNGKPIVTE